MEWRTQGISSRPYTGFVFSFLLRLLLCQLLGFVSLLHIHSWWHVVLSLQLTATVWYPTKPVWVRFELKLVVSCLLSITYQLELMVSSAPKCPLQFMLLWTFCNMMEKITHWITYSSLIITTVIKSTKLTSKGRAACMETIRNACKTSFEKPQMKHQRWCLQNRGRWCAVDSAGSGADPVTEILHELRNYQLWSSLSAAEPMVRRMKLVTFHYTFARMNIILKIGLSLRCLLVFQR